MIRSTPARPPRQASRERDEGPAWVIETGANDQLDIVWQAATSTLDAAEIA